MLLDDPRVVAGRAGGWIGLQEAVDVGLPPMVSRMPFRASSSATVIASAGSPRP